MIIVIYDDFDLPSYYRMNDVLTEIQDLIPEQTLIRSFRWSESIRRFLLLWDMPVPLNIPAILVESDNKTTLIYPQDFSDEQIEAIIVEFFKENG